jgi:hypothetical protein
MAENLGINELRVLSTLMGKEKYGLEIIQFVKEVGMIYGKYIRPSFS